MARFAGQVGYAVTQETAPGVHRESIVERQYKGDVVQDLRKLQSDDNLNGKLILQNHITIVADKFAFENYYNIRYVMWDGVRWEANYVEVKRPRLIIRFGGVYNGPTP